MQEALQNWTCRFLYINRCACPVNLSEELKKQTAILEKAQAEVSQMQDQLAEARAEMETIKAVATVSESTKQEAIDQVKQQWQEEVASLQAIMKGKDKVSDNWYSEVLFIVLFLLFETITKSFITTLKLTKLLYDTNMALRNNKKWNKQAQCKMLNRTIVCHSIKHLIDGPFIGVSLLVLPMCLFIFFIKCFYSADSLNWSRDSKDIYNVTIDLFMKHIMLLF